MNDAVGGDDAPTLDAEALARIRRIGGDALLRRMIAAFLDHTPARLEVTLTAPNAEDVMKAAHALKSSAGNLGLAQVGRVAEEIERRAAAGDATYADLRPDLARAFAAGRAALERELGGMDA